MPEPLPSLPDPDGRLIEDGDGAFSAGATPSLLRRGTETKARKLSWLWPGYLPRLPLMLDGEPGLGKSTATVDLAARITVAAGMPDGHVPDEPGVAVIMSSEDSWESTIKPRLAAVGADLNRVFHLPPETGFAIPDDIGKLTEALDAVRDEFGSTCPLLIVIDPLFAYIAQNLNTWNQHHVRLVFARLTPVCEQYQCAILMLRHLNKATDGKAITAGGGSIGIIAAVRTGWLVGIHPDDRDLEWDPETEYDPRRRVLAITKTNVAKFAPSRTFTIVPATPFELDGVTFTGDDIARIEWGDSSGTTADQLVREESPASHASKPVHDEVVRMLRELLKDGPRLADEVKKEVMREAQCSAEAVRRGRQDVGVVVEKEKALDGRWWWGLPHHDYRLLEQLGKVPVGTATVAEDVREKPALLF